ncbi:family 43 glycosylhydrolase [Marivirga atlantica]|uniref:Family 43 glycosylhydrolase n=1 Tax=Marivirga atlantica TaxID=1548457 RepID=A0A937DL57_9BACT|nr:family 43 glycosylhydrolase [Marivirga atlantica]MBL0766744.1 family 43 glycosylhydrolase [Marivirga atlantica]
MKRTLIILLSAVMLISCQKDGQNEQTRNDKTEQQEAKKNYKTYCNPIDIDYSYMSHYRAKNRVSYRSGADPAVVNFKGKYYMFVTRSHGYWVSDDMSNWQFIRPQAWYFQGSNAPAAAVYKDKIIAYGDPTGSGPIIETATPEKGDWQTNFAVLNMPQGIQDPDLFVDDDNRVYLFEESSNKWPIRGVELDPDNYFVPIGEQQDLFNLDADKHGWERFGQDHKSDIGPYIEGPWMVKNNGKYYLEYGAPGTQWNVYADGVYTSDSPLGPFTYADYNPISYKPGGFLKGSGHGSTVKDNNGNYWHFATMAISVNYKFERRIGMYPAGFEGEEGQMFVNTAYGDYPHYLPETKVDNHKKRFTGWMLLSYNKEVSTNSPEVKDDINVVDESSSGYMLEQIREFDINKINDEEIRSYWVSKANHDSIYVKVDLGEVMTINAVQINFQDFRSDIYGRPDTLKQQFEILGSTDGENWFAMADLSNNQKDMPHAYIELDEPAEARYVKYDHKYCTNNYLSISEFRVFGKGHQAKPATPANFKVSRQSDRRNTDLTWDAVQDAAGYVIYWGIKKDRLNLSALMYDKPNYELRALNTDQGYYYQVEAFNENGISAKSEILYTD